MPRKKTDDVVTVLDYFETAPVDAAKAVLAMAVAVVQKRVPAAPKADKKKVAPRVPKPKEQAGPGPSTTVGE